MFQFHGIVPIGGGKRLTNLVADDWHIVRMDE
jgi:hypothetical protein